MNGQAYTVQVAARMHEAFESIEGFGLILVFAIPVLLIAATAGGYWISKRALDPVDEISRAAQRISIENLADRLHVPNTGAASAIYGNAEPKVSRLEASVRRIKQFTADASHELRAPIALIRTTAEVAVQRRNQEAAEYLEALDDILEESERRSRAGMKSLTDSSIAILPSATSISTAVLVIAFPCEAMRKIVSGDIRVPASLSAHPNARS